MRVNYFLKALWIMSMILCSTTIYGQEFANLNFNDSSSGRNIGITYQKYLTNKFSVAGGFKIHINNIKHHDNQWHIYYNRFHAYRLENFIGLQGNLFLDVVSFKNKGKGFIFFDVQTTYARTKGETLIKGWDDNGFLFYTLTTDVRPHALAVEKTIGVGANAAILNNWFLELKAGAGITNYWFDYQDRFPYHLWALTFSSGLSLKCRIK